MKLMVRLETGITGLPDYRRYTLTFFTRWFWMPKKHVSEWWQVHGGLGWSLRRFGWVRFERAWTQPQETVSMQAEGGVVPAHSAMCIEHGTRIVRVVSEGGTAAVIGMVRASKRQRKAAGVLISLADEARVQERGLIVKRPES